VIEEVKVEKILKTGRKKGRMEEWKNGMMEWWKNGRNLTTKAHRTQRKHKEGRIE
jgi:hypothetical protein